MPIITIINPLYCQGKEIAENVADELGYKLLSHEAIERVVHKLGINMRRLEQILKGHTPFFNTVTHEYEKCIARIRLSVIEDFMLDQVVSCDIWGPLFPPQITHVLKIGLFASKEYRIEEAIRKLGMNRSAANKQIDASDADLSRWIKSITGLNLENNQLYDIKLAMDEISVEKAVKLIAENSKKMAVQVTEQSLQTLEDFQLAVQAKLALIDRGHIYGVHAHKGHVEVFVDRYVLRFENLKHEIKHIVDKMNGVEDITITTDFYHAESKGKKSRKAANVLLVDDEKDYAITLSKRLKLRSFGTTVAFSGEEALLVLQNEKPDVILLDLSMPGIDGIEVLKQVKKDHSDISVIIITGHGSKKDEEACKKLGAFAYLHKPVDFNDLTKIVNQAQLSVQKESLRINQAKPNN